MGWKPCLRRSGVSLTGLWKLKLGNSSSMLKELPEALGSLTGLQDLKVIGHRS